MRHEAQLASILSPHRISTERFRGLVAVPATFSWEIAMTAELADAIEYAIKTEGKCILWDKAAATVIAALRQAPQSEVRSEDATCYVERSKVREILITSNIDNESTAEVLTEVDALPIFVAGDFTPAAQEAGGCGANALEKAMTDCQIFSRTSSKSHQLVLEFTTLEGMQHARDIIIKASVPEVREFAQSGSTSKVIEACAKIAEPWSGFWLDKNSTDADRAVVEVRKEIAAKIRAMAVPSASRGTEA
jgi:hypothetical protein